MSVSDRTKLLLAKELKRKLKTTLLSRIKVRELCTACDVDRRTFYYHFKDKYDLMAWMIFQSAYDTDVLDLDSASKALDRMKKDCIFYKRAYEDNSQTPMWQYMLEYFVERYAQMAKQNLGTDTLDTQILYSIRLYCYGNLGMTREWVLTDNITPARTAAQMMLESMPETLKQIFPGK